jgi:amino acid transporter
MMHSKLQISPNWFSAGFAVLVTIYFWWENIKGMHESSGKALRIMQITTVMVVIFLIWCPLTLILRGPAQIPPAPLPQTSTSADDALGWFKGTFWPSIPLHRRHDRVRALAALHERLRNAGAGVSRNRLSQAEEPAITGNIVCIYAAVGTGVITVFASMIIPDAVRPSMSTICWADSPCTWPGPKSCASVPRFRRVVGVLILAGAVNTSIIGANGVMNRVAEDGVLVDWFRKPHRGFGTTFRIINLIALLQI